MITTKSNNKFTIVSIVKWEDYQEETILEQQQNNNKVTTKEQQNNTNKNVKNVKNVKKNNIVEIYKTVCTKLPQVQKITDKRNKAIEKFLKEFTEEQFIEICKIANSTDFLIGKNENGWKADFDFLMRTDKATNILEGKYSCSTVAKQTKAKPEQREYAPGELSKLYANLGGNNVN